MSYFIYSRMDVFLFSAGDKNYEMSLNTIKTVSLIQICITLLLPFYVFINENNKLFKRNLTNYISSKKLEVQMLHLQVRRCFIFIEFLCY